VQPIELERYLHEHIPLTRAMAVTVRSLDASGVLLAAPLAPNINHRETVFGGSAAALAILAGWALLHVRLAGEGRDARLVIQRNTMEYVRPIAGEFTARAALVAEPHWSRFAGTLERRGRARITVLARLEQAGEDVGHFNGEFVALTS
jgi:thioesterase domain-containing protein